MRAMFSAAVVAVALVGCGPDLDEAPAVGSAAQAVVVQPEPVIGGPERLNTDQVLTPVIGVDPNRAFQDHFAYTVHSLGPNH